jgi:hypothetical protein
VKKTFKATNTCVIVKRFKEMQEKFAPIGDQDIDKLKFLDGEIIDIGKSVDREEYKIGDIIHTAEFTASDLGDGFYVVDINDVMCKVLYEEED